MAMYGATMQLPERSDNCALDRQVGFSVHDASLDRRSAIEVATRQAGHKHHHKDRHQPDHSLLLVIVKANLHARLHARHEQIRPHGRAGYHELVCRS